MRKQKETARQTLESYLHCVFLLYFIYLILLDPTELQLYPELPLDHLMCC